MRRRLSRLGIGKRQRLGGYRGRYRFWLRSCRHRVEHRSRGRAAGCVPWRRCDLNGYRPVRLDERDQLREGTFDREHYRLEGRGDGVSEAGGMNGDAERKD